MKWFMLVTFLNVSGGYVYYSPAFDSTEECVAYARNNADDVIGQALESFPGSQLKQVYCVKQDTLEKMMKSAQPNGLNV